MRPALVSFGLHVAAFLLVLRFVPRSVDRPAPVETEPPSIEIVDDELSSTPSTSTPSTSPPSASAGGATSGASQRPAIAAVVRGAPASLGDPIAETLATAESPATAPMITLPGPIVPLTTAELGIGEKNPFLGPASVAVAEPEPNRRDKGAERSMREALRERDRSLGLTKDGPVLSALKDATSTSLAPVNGRAVFTVRADGQGVVLGIDLEQASGGSGWDDARKRALDGLRGKKLSVPSGARGINVRVEVVSEVSYASGQKTAGEIGLRPGAVVLPDESNIGAKPARKIHARALGAEVL